MTGDGNVQDPYAEKSNFALPSTAVCTINLGANKGKVVPCPGGPYQRRDQTTDTTTNALFIGDSWKATKNLTFDFGVKQIFIHRAVENGLPYADPGSNTLNDTATLPTAGVSYQLDQDNKVFASFGTTFRSAPNFTLASSYSVTSGALTPPNAPKPEEGKVYEVGHRYQGSLFATSISGFLGRYENYQQSTSIIDSKSGTTSLINETLNLGGVMNYGVDAEIGTRPIYNFRPYVSGELLHTELLDNLRTDTSKGTTDFLRTKGKQLPGAPEYQFGIGLDYDDGHIFANTAYKYLGTQYSTLVNDERINGYGRVDASIGYRFSDVGFLKQPEIRLQLFNILNDRFLTGVSGVQNNAKAQVGVNGGTIAGSTPTYFQGQDFSGLVTFKAGF